MRNFFNLQRGAITAALFFLGLSIYYKIQLEDYEVKLAKNQARHEAEMRILEKNQFQGVIDAINVANEQKIRVEVDSGNAESANKRLHQTIDRLNVQVSNLATSARVEYSNALSDVLKECTVAYREVARKADGHATDAQMMKQIFEKASYQVK